MRLYLDQGPFLKRDDARPYRKRVEVYSAAYDPGTGGCVDQSSRVPLARTCSVSH